ncbi:MAG: GerMN domain-containing protein [Bacillota bacterium]
MKNYRLLLIPIILIIMVTGFLLLSKKTPRKEPGGSLVNPGPQVQSCNVVLYFINEKYADTGNENIPHLLPETRKLKTGCLAETAVLELQRGTKRADLSTAIRPDLKILGVITQSKIAFVNFSSVNLHGGSLEERMILEQIIATLTGLEGIEKVQFLVDGKNTETLMGHYDITRPFDRTDKL